MSKVFEKTICCQTTAFTLFAAVALVVPSPTSLELSAAIDDGPVGQVNGSVVCKACISAALLSEDAQENMATNGKPGNARPAYLALPPILKPDSPDKRLKKQTPSYRSTTFTSARPDWRYDVLTSTSLISSNLGRRITLVGAKPSGTS